MAKSLRLTSITNSDGKACAYTVGLGKGGWLCDIGTTKKVRDLELSRSIHYASRVSMCFGGRNSKTVGADAAGAREKVLDGILWGARTGRMVKLKKPIQGACFM